MKRIVIFLAVAAFVVWIYVRPEPTAPSSTQVMGVALTGVVSAGDDHIVAIDANGDLYGWGDNRNKQLVVGNMDFAPIPKLLKQDADFRFVATGFRATYAISTSGKLWRYRVFDEHACARGECAEIYGSVFGRTQWRKIKSASNFFAGIDTQDAMWLWREPSIVRDNLTEPVRVPVLPNNGWKDMCFASNQAYAIAADGALWRYQGKLSEQDSWNASGLTLTPVGVQAKFDRVYCRIEAGHVLALAADGQLWGFGSNTYGELGNGRTESSVIYLDEQHMTPIGDQRWMDVGVGIGFTIAIAGDGSLWGWGSNSGGQLGIGDERGGGKPRLINRERQWAMIATGGGYTAALTRDGELYTWGGNRNGVLGIGTGIAERKTPTKVFGTEHWSVSEGGSK